MAWGEVRLEVLLKEARGYMVSESVKGLVDGLGKWVVSGGGQIYWMSTGGRAAIEPRDRTLCWEYEEWVIMI